MSKQSGNKNLSKVLFSPVKGKVKLESSPKKPTFKDLLSPSPKRSHSKNKTKTQKQNENQNQNQEIEIHIAKPSKFVRKNTKSKTTLLSKNNILNSFLKSSTKLFQNPEFRDYMEDFTLTVHSFMKDSTKHLFGIFDGHGGDKSAKLSSSITSDILAKFLKESPFNVEQCLRKTFSAVDLEVKKANYKHIGNTMTIVYIQSKMLYCANVGDSSCVLVCKENGKKISYDDKATDPNEMKRIESENGKVIDDRLNGILAISRGIGDFDLKNKGLSSEPHLYKCLIDEDVDYCVIASDGVWDVLTPEDIYRITKHEKNTDIIVENIVNEAIEKGSEDNISCIVICLKTNN